MLKDYLDRLRSGKDIKETLTEFKKLLKDRRIKESETKVQVLREYTDCFEVLSKLLDDEDPKNRKNAALCLGLTADMLPDDADTEGIVNKLFESYVSDQTKYNKAAYLEAIGCFDYSCIKDKLIEVRNEIITRDIAEEDKKHVLEEMSELNGLLRKDIEKPHEFTGFSLVNEAALLTNRNFKNITIKELGSIPHKEFTAGVMIKTKMLRRVMSGDCRTFSEILFIQDNSVMLDPDADKAAETLIANGLTEYIETRHSNPDAPFYFRVELRCKDEKNKANNEKKLASRLELYSKWKLINSVSDYDLEFRFIENSTGKLQLLIGMHTLPDERFSYRKAAISAGMKPSLAALLIRLGADYIKENSVVLDPVCGSGIFLIEREKYMHTQQMLYGIDIYGEAIEAAKKNIHAAGYEDRVNLIKRDFFDFRHQYRFDEIIADMPRITSGKNSSEIENFYMRFFKKCKELIKEQGRLFIYTHNRNVLRRYVLKEGYRILNEFEISKKEEAYYFILQYGG